MPDERSPELLDASALPPHTRTLVAETFHAAPGRLCVEGVVLDLRKCGFVPNSIDVIKKHVAGNLISRWIDFLTTDGEKADRQRDDEFVDSFRSRAEVLEHWNRGWSCLLSTLRNLTADDLTKTVHIRGEPHSVPLAIQRSLGHTCYHVGQIVQVARIHAGTNWKTLTIPRGGSEEFNRRQREEATRSRDAAGGDKSAGAP